MSSAQLKAIIRDLSSGNNGLCEAAFEALEALPDAERRAWMEEPLRLIGLKDGVIEFRSDVSLHRVFRRRHTRVANALAMLRLVGRLDGLECLDLTVMPVTALYPLAGLTTLHTLSMLGDPDAPLDLTPLSGLTALRSLELQRAQVYDLRPLIGLKKLQTLAIRESWRLEDARPLLAMPGLQRLDLGGCGKIRPRRERAMMPDAAAVRRYRAKIARAMKRAPDLTAEERRWLVAAQSEGLQRTPVPALTSEKALKRLLGSQDSEIARQGLELLKALTGEQLAGVADDEVLFPWMLGAPSAVVRQLGIRLLLQHVSPERARGLAEGISLDEDGYVELKSGVGRRGYLRGARQDSSTPLALLRAAGRLDAEPTIVLESGTVLSDNAVLAGLPHLSSLTVKLGGKPERVFEGLRELPKLRVLEVSRAQTLDSIQALQQLPSLQEVSIGSAYFVRTLEGLRPLRQLRAFSISSAHHLKDIADLSDASELEELELYIAPLLRDLSPIAALRRLRKLTLVGCGNITDLGPLTALHQLETLEIRNLDGVEDISPLAGLTALKTLTIHCKALSSLDALAMLTGLQTLSLTNTTGSLPSLDDLSSLMTLTLGQCAGLTSLSSLSGLTELQTLRIESAPLLALAGISSLPALSTLVVEECGDLTDIAALSSLPALERLTIGESPQLTDLSALKGCTALSMLCLSTLGVQTPYNVFGREKVAQAIARLLQQ